VASRRHRETSSQDGLKVAGVAEIAEVVGLGVERPPRARLAGNGQIVRGPAAVRPSGRKGYFFSRPTKVFFPRDEVDAKIQEK